MRHGAALTRRLGLLDGASTVAGIILGSGIFVAPAVLAPWARGPWEAAAVWLVGAAIALCGALCYAECGARLPRDGGFFVFYEVAFGPVPARLAGWAALAVTYPASLAGVALIGAGYLGELVPALAGATRPLAAAMLAATTLLNLLGVRLGAWAQRLLTGTKVVALLMLCAAALWAGSPVAAAPGPRPPLTVGHALAAFAVLMWTYDGWTDVTLLAGEIRDPGRNLSRAVCLGLGALALVYAVVQVAVARLLPAAAAAASPHVLADATAAALGAAAGRAVAWLVVLSTAGSVLGLGLATSRLAYAMACHGAIPRQFAQVQPRLGTPARALGGVLLLALGYLLSGSFAQLLSLFSLAIWLFYALTAVALVRLRRRRIGEPLPWRAPLWPLPAVVTVAAASGMTALQAAESPRRVLVLAALVAALAVGARWRPGRPAPGG